MSKCYGIPIVLVLLLMVSCGDEIERPMNRVGSLKGVIRLYTEFGAEVKDRSGTTVRLAAGESSYQGTTDANGNYSVDVPTGTYVVTAEKEGYVSKDGTVQVAGSGDAVYYYSYLLGVTTSTITNLELTISGSEVIVEAFLKSLQPMYTPVEVFFGTSATVGPTDFLFERSFFTDQDRLVEHLPLSAFEKGARIYAVAYCSVNGFGSVRFNYKTRQYEFSPVGPTPSNIVTLQMP